MTNNITDEQILTLTNMVKEIAREQNEIYKHLTWTNEQILTIAKILKEKGLLARKPKTSFLVRKAR